MPASFGAEATILAGLRGYYALTGPVYQPGAEVKVALSGLAKSGADETVTASHMVISTPACMAPEQREGKLADARTDIYSFACILYKMLTGVRVTAQRKRIPSQPPRLL